MKKIVYIIIIVILAAYSLTLSYLCFCQDGVYISASGECYHKDPHCSNMVNVIKITEEEAEKLYRTPCRICVND